MFIGHFAVGLALKRAAPRVSLGWLMAAPNLLDLLWPWFLLLGWERVRIEPGNTAFTPLAFDSYPISHSLVMSVVWGAALALLYFWRGHRVAAALWIAAGVVSHWVLDWIVHRPDLPIAPWSAAKFGLGLWNSVPATLVVESLMYAAAIAVYVRGTRARDRAGHIGFWSFVAIVGLIYAGNVFSAPPPSASAVAVVTLGLWLFPFWAAWFDRHRAAVAE